jgi:ABC-type polysaccharide/polyol phosphate export permease
MVTRAEATTISAASTPPLRERLRELACHCDLVLSFARRDIRARYRQTVLGIAWAVLQPFSLMVIFTLVFSKLARVPSDGVPYPIFVYSALIFWTFFTTSITQGTIALVANSSLVRKIYFPRETLLVAVLMASSLDLAIASVIFGGMLVYYQVALHWTLLWILPLFGLQVILTFAIVCITSAVHVYFRDIGHAMPLCMQLWMFATPIAYPLSLVPDRFLPVYLLNPMASLIEGYRRVILLGQSPNLVHLLVGFHVGVLLLVLGYLGFTRAERTFADVI